MNQAYVFDVKHSNFNDTVIGNSHKLPVLVEFMGVWSGPCASMERLFTDLAQEFAGQFIFAKVDIDEQPELLAEHQVTNVPTLLVFQNGALGLREEGEIQEDEARLILRGLGIFRESDDQRERARELHLNGQTQDAVMLLTEAIQQDPGNPRIVMDMVQIFLDMKQWEAASNLYHRLPEKNRDSAFGRSLYSQLGWLEKAQSTDGIPSLLQRIHDDPADLKARFDLAICHLAEHRLDEAMEQLFESLNQNAQFQEGAARELIGLLCNALETTDPALANDYRRRLANLLAR